MTRKSNPKERDQLSDSVAAEGKLLESGPSIAKDGPRIRHESDTGATAETMLTASQILDAQSLGAELANLHQDADEIGR